MAWNSSLGSVLTPALVPAGSTAWKKQWKTKKYQQENVTKIRAEKMQTSSCPQSHLLMKAGESVRIFTAARLSGWRFCQLTEGKREKPQRNTVTDLTKPPWGH